MRKRLVLLFITSLLITNTAKADFGLLQQADFTGEAFFTPAEEPKNVVEEKEDNSTIPPIKLLRMKIQAKKLQKEREQLELAPTSSKEKYTGEIETSEYASKDEEDNFEDISADEIDTEDVLIEDEKEKKDKKLWRKKNKKSQQDESENIILDCEEVNYDTQNYLVYATGNVNVDFVKQGISVKSDIITFDRLNNTIKAEGNVRIVKNGQTVTGDYIFVDMNEENALIENPISKTGNMEIKSKKGFVYSNRAVLEKGTIEINDTYPVNFHSANRGPRIRTMMYPKDQTLSEDMSKGIVKLKAQDIKITQKGEHEIISVTKPQLFKGDKTVFKMNSIKLYTNKNHDYVENGSWEIGSYRGLGLYGGPSAVFELPKGSVLKVMPILNYKSGFGIGGLGRFSSSTNQTMLAYGTAQSKFVGYGRQELDDNLFLQYGHNGYMDEWFLGKRRPKYGVSLVYDKTFYGNNFLLKDHPTAFRHRLEGGYFQDLDFDRKFEKIAGGNNIGTPRFRYMAEGRQNLFRYVNKEEMKAFSFDLSSQLSAAAYGTGDTQVVGRFGPRIHSQYKRWMQDVVYYMSAYEDNTPMPLYDSYRYGKHTLYLREYYRLCRWLTLSWFGAINLSNDAINGRTFQENGFYFSFGPDDLKVSLGYDFIRENIYCTVEVMMDAKGTKVEYDTFEIKQEKKAKKDEKPKVEDYSKKAPTQPKVLQRAVVENLQEHEDVI